MLMSLFVKIRAWFRPPPPRPEPTQSDSEFL
jgi:hypothetical protein